MRLCSLVLSASFVVGLGACNSEPRVRERRIDDPLELPPPEDALEAAIQERAPTEAMLMIPHEGVVRGELAQGERRDFSTALRPGLCYKVLGQGGPGVEDLDLLVYDRSGSLLQRDTSTSDRPVIGMLRAICPVEPDLYRIEVRMAQGSGTYAVQVWVSQ